MQRARLISSGKMIGGNNSWRFFLVCRRASVFIPSAPAIKQAVERVQEIDLINVREVR